jgi:mannose-6-phosphate isomerase
MTGSLADTGFQMTEERPWGRFTVLLDSPLCKVKQIEVMPGHRLSLQLHHPREEHWTIVQGSPVVTLADTEARYQSGEHIHIPAETRHRLANPGPDVVVFIEVQLGTYFGEDDIVRFEDDYQRISITDT